MFASTVFSTVVTHKFRIMLADLGAIAVPAETHFFLFIPAWLSIAAGCLLACGVGSYIWKLNHSWIAIPVSLFTAVLVFVYLGLFAAAMMRPIGRVIGEIETLKTGEPTNALYSSPAAGSKQ